MRWRVFAFLALCMGLHSASGPVLAEAVDVCFNYGCHQRKSVEFSAQSIEQLRELLSAASDTQSERALISLAVGRMYAVAAAQTPIWRDRGRNDIDERHLDGAMDCIDHSTNTQSFLRLLSDKGLLRFHLPGEREVRYLFLVFGEHWAATVTEISTGQRYAVDSWFLDPGFPAILVMLERWKAGFDPEQTAEAAR